MHTLITRLTLSVFAYTKYHLKHVVLSKWLTKVTGTFKQSFSPKRKGKLFNVFKKLIVKVNSKHENWKLTVAMIVESNSFWRFDGGHLKS